MTDDVQPGDGVEDAPDEEAALDWTTAQDSVRRLLAVVCEGPDSATPKTEQRRFDEASN